MKREIAIIISAPLTILHTENNHTKINVLEEMEITKVVTLPIIQNNITSNKNDPFKNNFIS